MSTEEELQRQIGINLQLRRKLEAVRRDVVEECAKFCEENWLYPGDAYAKGLREMIGK